MKRYSSIIGIGILTILFVGLFINVAVGQSDDETPIFLPLISSNNGEAAASPTAEPNQAETSTPTFAATSSPPPSATPSPTLDDQGTIPPVTVAPPTASHTPTFTLEPATDTPTPTATSTPTPEPDVVIPDTTIVLDEGDEQELLAVSDNMLIFEGSAEVLEEIDVNDVLVSGVSEAAPYGFLRKVESVVEQNGQIVVQTSQAALSEAVEDGQFSIRQTLVPDEVQAASNAPNQIVKFTIPLNDIVLHDVDGNTNTKNDQIVVNGDITLEPTFDLSGKIRDSQLEQFYFASTIEQDAELILQRDLGIGVELRKAVFSMRAVGSMIATLAVVDNIQGELGIEFRFG